MITSKNLVYHELIGLHVEVSYSSTKSLIGLNGKVIDETKKTLTIETSDNCEKLLPKDVSIFQFKIPDGTWVEVDGRILLSRPEDRIKKRYKKI
ncbi:MAG: ribonuclease P protein component 1 [Methanobrevibacter boviskoreani]|jgi:ribonuclease P protein subunit POP4|uniref:ribonuclease P protein component 1 n=1 Tax=Methanobrevibacter TaxID=2172 RepID=UPI0003348480|nr:MULTISPECIES: ribonuclease P protein component 1 [Methanobrevibacter]AGN17150.1 ribonuclease P subunit P29 [Methanobrevibacter sp. AbM4]